MQLGRTRVSPLQPVTCTTSCQAKAPSTRPVCWQQIHQCPWKQDARAQHVSEHIQHSTTSCWLYDQRLSTQPRCAGKPLQHTQATSAFQPNPSSHAANPATRRCGIHTRKLQSLSTNNQHADHATKPYPSHPPRAQHGAPNRPHATMRYCSAVLVRTAAPAVISIPTKVRCIIHVTAGAVLAVAVLAIRGQHA